MRVALAAVAVIVAVTLFAGLGRMGAVDRREARDVQVARELIQAREALTPVLGSEPLFEKPILAYGPDVVVQLVSRAPLEASRAWRSTALVLLIVLVAATGVQHFGMRAGVLAAGVLATSLATPLAARTDGTQVLAAFLGWAGAAGFADAWFGRPAGRDLRLVVAYGMLAAAAVCAGPLPALWPFGAAALYAVLARPEGGARVLRWAPGLLMVTGLSLPWYGAMAERHGADFLSRVAFFPYAVEPRGSWLLGPVLALSYVVVGFFPWSAVLPLAFQHAAQGWRGPRAVADARGVDVAPLERDVREVGASTYFVACAVAAAAPLVLYPTPPLSAALPVLPAAALLCGRLLDHALERPDRLRRPLGRATLMLAIIGTALAAAFVTLATRLTEVASDLRAVGTAVFVASWAPALAAVAGRPRVAALLVALPVAVATPIVTWRLAPAMESYFNTRAVAETLNRTAPPRAPVLVVEEPPPSFRWYAARNLIPVETLPESLAAFRARDGRVYVAFRPLRERMVSRAASRPLEVLRRTPSLVLARVQP